MSFNKQFLKSKPVCKVKFKLSKEQAGGAEQVRLLGEFDNWSEQGVSMRKLKDGSFSAQLDLECGKEYRCRYLLDGTRWKNDPEADGYEYCSFSGEENFIVSC